MRLVGARLLPYALPFRSTLRSSHGCFSHRRGWLLAVEDDAGGVGWGDAAPWPGFGTAEHRVASELSALVEDQTLVGLSFDAPAALWEWLARQQFAPEVAYAVELAILDRLCSLERVPLAVALGAEPGTRDARTHVLVTGYPDPLAHVLKVKVGSSLDEAERRVAELSARALPGAVIRVDAGGGWTEVNAHAALERLARYGVEWVEEPLAPGAWAALARLARHARDLGMVIALDESVKSERDLSTAVDAGALDALVVKPMFVGGLDRARRLALVARDAGVEAIVTTALESAVGVMGTVHLAAALPGIHGLSSLLARDVAVMPERLGERIPLPVEHGLGIVPFDVDELRPSNGGGADASHGSPPRATWPSSATEPSALCIPNPVKSAALARPHHPALVSDRQALSYGELALRVSSRAATLAARGIAPGMTIALQGHPDVHWVIDFHALGWLGATALPLPPAATDRERSDLIRAVRPAVCLDPHERCRSTAPLAERFWPLSEARVTLASSGTTGAPRVVTLDTAQLLFSAFGSAIRLGHDPADRWLSCLPLHHVAGVSILMRAAFYGITVVLEPHFDAERVAVALDSGDATLVSLVPQMLPLVLDARSERPFPPTVRAILVGGAAIDDGLMARCRALGAPVAATWGMTEAASQVATRAPGDLRAEGGSGAPVAFARVEARGERLVVRGPVVAGAELVTSDCGRVASDGRVHVLGRADAVIVSGGEKLDPAEIESVLRSHEAVADAVVVGLPSQRWGQRPAALMVRKGAREASDAALRAWCRRSLRSFKVPDHFAWCDDLPRTALGKVSRSRALQQLFVGGMTEVEHAREEHDARAVDLEESCGDPMNERHADE